MRAAAQAGYSGTPLPKKLGMKPGQVVGFVALQPELAWLASAEPFARADEAASADGLHGPYDLVHGFYLEADRLEADLPLLRAAIAPAGAIWISWPKKAAKVATDITEDVIRALALPALVDVKVCAVSDVWSGLKLVIPVKDRPHG